MQQESSTSRQAATAYDQGYKLLQELQVCRYKLLQELQVCRMCFHSFPRIKPAQMRPQHRTLTDANKAQSKPDAANAQDINTCETLACNDGCMNVQLMKDHSLCNITDLRQTEPQMPPDGQPSWLPQGRHRLATGPTGMHGMPDCRHSFCP
jgi:hypothetical protein